RERRHRAGRGSRPAPAGNRVVRSAGAACVARLRAARSPWSTTVPRRKAGREAREIPDPGLPLFGEPTPYDIAGSGHRNREKDVTETAGLAYPLSEGSLRGKRELSADEKTPATKGGRLWKTVSRGDAGIGAQHGVDGTGHVPVHGQAVFQAGGLDGPQHGPRRGDGPRKTSRARVGGGLQQQRQARRAQIARLGEVEHERTRGAHQLLDTRAPPGHAQQVGPPD